MKTIMILIMVFGVSVNVYAEQIPSGTVVCKSIPAWKEYSRAIVEKDDRALGWLMGSACYELGNDTVVRIEQDSGGFSKVRLRVKSAPSAWVLSQSIKS
ncbi:MAG: hypothetical protein ACWA5R_01135 [bacterium]